MRPPAAPERPWALVTGGARRVGRALVEAAAAAGYAVCVHVHRSLEAGEVVAADLSSRGVPAMVVERDLADVDATEALIPELHAKGCAPQLLVNNAALFAHDRLATADAAAFDRHMAVNLRAPLLLARSFAAALPAAVEGHIVNLVDQRVFGTSPHFLTYSLSKAGLVALTRLLAVELAPRIRVNAIAPGLALPDIGTTAAHAEALRQSFPLRTGGSPDDLAATLAYLIQTRSITGAVLCVDGGAHLGVRRV